MPAARPKAILAPEGPSWGYLENPASTFSNWSSKCLNSAQQRTPDYLDDHMMGFAWSTSAILLIHDSPESM